jgi:[ribosomal protein S5]-alanine N-acetyltransferase
VTRTRLVVLDDVDALTKLVYVNRRFLAPWDPLRDESYFTEAGQLAVVHEVLSAYERGVALPHVILDERGKVAGRITLNGIVGGPFLSCSVGYWVNEADNGRGLASAAVGAIKQLAFDEMRLHRIQAETLAENAASRRVLERNGFSRFGFAPQYLKIAGRWQDHVMYQTLKAEHQ